MYTAESLLNCNSSVSRNEQKPRLGVLTNAQAKERAEQIGTVVLIGSSKRNVFFFSDNHIFGYPLLPKDFVPATMTFPMRVVEREEVPDGWITTIEQLIAVFEKDSTQLNSIDELVEHLNTFEKPKTKAKQITDASQLFDGQMVLRAVCNCHGKIWVEVSKIIGTVYKKDIECFSKPSEMIMTIGSHRYSQPTETHISTLGAVDQKGIKQHACFEYSEELYNTLQGLLDNRAEFLEYINERKLTDEELSNLIYEWGQMVWMDEMSEQAHYGPEHRKEYPFLNDESIKHLIPEFMTKK